MQLGIQNLKATKSHNQDTDEALATVWMQQGDRSAFNAIFDRNQNFAYRTAFGLFGDFTLAQEAVQEAFCILMRRDVSFRDVGPGSFRRWFFGVIKNVTFKQVRSEKRKRERTQKQQYRDRIQDVMFHNDGESTGSKVTDKEARNHLHKALKELSPDYRVPIVLHFLEGMTQAETGQNIGISRRAVEKRLEKGLDQLRYRLTQAGISFSAVWLTQVLQNDPDLQISSETAETVLQQIQTMDSLNTSADFSPSNSATESLTWGWVPFLMVVALGTSVVVFTNNENEEISQVPTTEITPEQSTPPNENSIAQWTFDQGRPVNIETIRSNWTWQKNGQSGEMAVAPDEGVTILLPKIDLPKNFTVDISAEPSGPNILLSNDTGHWVSSHLFWEKENVLPPLSIWLKSEFKGFKTEKLNIQIHVRGIYTIQQINGITESVMKYERPESDGRLILEFINLKIQDINIRLPHPSESETMFADPDSLAQSLSRNPQSRNRIPLLPKLTSSETQNPKTNAPLRSTFSAKSLAGFTIVGKSTTTIPWDNKQKALRFENLATVFTPYDISQNPLHITLTLKPIREGKGQKFGVFPATDRLIRKGSHDDFFPLHFGFNSYFQIRLLILNDAILGVTQNKVLFDGPLFPIENRLALGFSNFFVQSIDVKIPSAQEIAAARRYLENKTQKP